MGFIRCLSRRGQSPRYISGACLRHQSSGPLSCMLSSLPRSRDRRRVQVSLILLKTGNARILSWLFPQLKILHHVCFSETKYIAVAIVGMLQVMVVGLPLLFIVQENATALFFMESAILFVFCMAVLLLIFIPKMLYIKNYAHHSQVRQMRKMADTMLRASKGMPINSTGANQGSVNAFHHPSTDSNVTTGVLITHFGAASLEQENIDLKQTVAKLKELLEQHDIVYENDGIKHEPEIPVLEENIAMNSKNPREEK